MSTGLAQLLGVMAGSLLDPLTWLLMAVSVALAFHKRTRPLFLVWLAAVYFLRVQISVSRRADFDLPASPFVHFVGGASALLCLLAFLATWVILARKDRRPQSAPSKPTDR